MQKSELAALIDQDFENQVTTLENLIRIPSVSSPSFPQENVQKSAEYVAEKFTQLGGEVQILAEKTEAGWEGRPAVVAQFPAKLTDPKLAPTVLLYAHHDVQPGGDPNGWSNGDPFSPYRKDGRLYGRGASDDGAGIIVHLGALTALKDQLGVNVTVFIEGEEEVGSPSFTTFLERHRELLDADLIVVTDSDNWKVGKPAITTSLRGVVSLTVRLRVLAHALHSGMYGGPILDAVTLASRLIATLHDETGSVAVAGLNSRDVAAVTYPEADFREDSGLLEGVQLAGKGDLASRLWTQPAISVIGMDATSVAEASNTIAPVCTFTLSLRVAPGQDSAQAREFLEQHLRANAPFGARLEILDGECGPAYQAKDSDRLQDVRWALETAWGIPPVDIGVGGSIPFIADFQQSFPHADVVVTGVEDPATNAHSEDESQHLGDLRNAIFAEALLLAKLGGNLADS